jgi:hypothetical protein
VALAVVGVLVAVIAGALSTDTSSIGDKLVPKTSLPTDDGQPAEEPSDPAEPKPASPPTGLASGSLLRPVLFARALAKASGASHGRLKLVRLAPERADLQFARANGGLDLVQVRWDGNAPTVVRTPSGGAGGPTPLVARRIDVRAPRRLAARAAARLHRKPSAVDYLVLLDVAGTSRWSVYFKGGAAFMGDARGRITQRIQ